MPLTANTLAADIHKRMCDDQRFGYSWAERYGATPETWTVDGKVVRINVGDYDCSSSTITAWKLALKAFGYGDILSGATYTGNMRSVFTRTGLFQWRTDLANAQRGDLYLNEANHVAMCQGGGRLSEFSSSETGGIYGRRGDQTGWESHVCGYYSYPWNGYLHYIGTKKEDETEGELIVATQQEIDRIAAAVNSYVYGNEDKKANLNAYNAQHWGYGFAKQAAERTKALETKVAALDKKLDQVIKLLG